MTKIVLLWLLSKTIVDVSYVLYRWTCASNHFSIVRFVFEEIWKSYSVINSVSANLHVPFPHKVYVPIRTALVSILSVPSLKVSAGAGSVPDRGLFRTLHLLSTKTRTDLPENWFYKCLYLTLLSL